LDFVNTFADVIKESFANLYIGRGKYLLPQMGQFRKIDSIKTAILAIFDLNQLRVVCSKHVFNGRS
jgi:hypothetical protein